MKFISSTLLTVMAVLPLIAAQTLNKPLHVIIATDWDSGIVSIENGPVIAIPDDAPLMIPIDVGGHTKDYRQVHECILNEVDRDQVKRFSFSRVVDQQASTIKNQFALTSEPGVEYVHIILNDKYAANINVFGDAFEFFSN